MRNSKLSKPFQQQATQPPGADNRWEIMARLYFEKLTSLLLQLDLGDQLITGLTVKHYFNGAAVYADQRICASWSPVGLAFKLAADESRELIASGQGKPLKYFAKSPIKQGYVLFDNPESKSRAALQDYFLRAAEQALAARPEAGRGRHLGTTG